MLRIFKCLWAASLCLLAASCSNGAAPPSPTRESRAAEPPDPAAESLPIEGLWTGSWGGGDIDGVVYQPVLAELFIAGDQVELHGFPNVGALAGTVRFDTTARKMRITPTAEPGVQPPAIEYQYEVTGDQLTLTGSEGTPVLLQTRHALQDPLANVQVEFVTASGMDDAGDLHVTEFTQIKAGRADTTWYVPFDRSLSTRQGTVLLAEETGCRQLTLDEARELLREPTPVVVAFRPDDHPLPQTHGLWRETGPPAPDSDAVALTLSRIVRPGILVFILSAAQNVPVP